MSLGSRRRSNGPEEMTGGSSAVARVVGRRWSGCPDRGGRAMVRWPASDLGTSWMTGLRSPSRMTVPETVSVAAARSTAVGRTAHAQPMRRPVPGGESGRGRAGPGVPPPRLFGGHLPGTHAVDPGSGRSPGRTVARRRGSRRARSLRAPSTFGPARPRGPAPSELEPDWRGTGASVQGARCAPRTVDSACVRWTPRGDPVTVLDSSPSLPQWPRRTVAAGPAGFPEGGLQLVVGRRSAPRRPCQRMTITVPPKSSALRCPALAMTGRLPRNAPVPQSRVMARLCRESLRTLVL